MARFVRRTRVDVPAAELCAWHARSGAFERLRPPWESVDLRQHGGIQDGSVTRLRVRIGPFRVSWVALHQSLPNRLGFRDVQIEGPFARWSHTHAFLEDGPAASVLEDEIEYALPLGAIGSSLAGASVARKLGRMFAYRHRVTRFDLEAHAAARRSAMTSEVNAADRSPKISDDDAAARRPATTSEARGAGRGAGQMPGDDGTGQGGPAASPNHERLEPRHHPMRILMTGASGLIGQTLTAYLNTAGHEVVPLTRAETKRPGSALGLASGVRKWNPTADRIDPAVFDGIDAVIHLAGENVARARWTQKARTRIRGSRVRGTRLLAEGMAACDPPPSILISASATGFYGDRGDEELTEASPAGTGFLAEVAQAWERAAEPAVRAGVRAVHPRIGMVLSPAGGALARLLPAFRLGLGARLGHGRQWMSWIAMDDLLYAFEWMLLRRDLHGPLNLTAPGPVTNRDFARILGRVLRRPAILNAPASALRLLLGEMGKEMLLSSQRVLPARLRDSGFNFRHPHLEGALRHLLGAAHE